MSFTSIEPAPLTIPFHTGDVIAGKYEVVGVLGTGGVAYVISALHLELGEMVAIKFLRPESLAYEEVVARFASEARAVARIKSEHVAHVYDVGALPDGAPFIVMEYLEGKDLSDVLAERRRLPVRVAVDYVLQACEALACAHATGIVHRDIKPENLFLTQQAASVEVVKVLDFGISKSAMAGHERGGRASAKTTLPMGTPGYMSPEQVRACSTVDARTDIWALGCVLSELITGASTFQAPTQVQLGAAILEADPIPLRQVVPDAPAELEAVISRCVAKDPKDRFQDIAELATALYPFGPRRARLSAERCHQILKGRHGVVIEFNSVPPPAGSDTPLPASSAAPVVRAVPHSLPTLDLVEPNSPTTLNAIEPPRPRRTRRALVAAGLAAATAAAGFAALRAGVGVPARADAVSALAAAARAPSPLVQSPPAPVSPAEPQPKPRIEPSAAPATAAAAPTASAHRATPSHASASRARVTRVVPRPEPPPESPAPKPKPASTKRAGLLDEPDVGY